MFQFPKEKKMQTISITLGSLSAPKGAYFAIVYLAQHLQSHCHQKQLTQLKQLRQLNSQNLHNSTQISELGGAYQGPWHGRLCFQIKPVYPGGEERIEGVERSVTIIPHMGGQEARWNQHKSTLDNNSNAQEEEHGRLCLSRASPWHGTEKEQSDPADIHKNKVP